MRRFFVYFIRFVFMSFPSDYRLIVFLKAPRPGFVKTRLAASVGPDKACEIYRKLVSDLLSRIESLANVDLRIAPDHAANDFSAWCRPEWRVRPQGEGNLGDRLCRAFEEAFQEGAKPVVAIGSDCPDVGADEILGALDVLSQSPVTLGPAVDGGYWLVGMTEFLPSLFEGIDWSTDQVLSQTERAVAKRGLKSILLKTLEDVDDLESWNRYRQKNEKNEMDY